MQAKEAEERYMAAVSSYREEDRTAHRDILKEEEEEEEEDNTATVAVAAGSSKTSYPLLY